MGKVTRAYPHLTEEEIRNRVRESIKREIVQKWLAILNATVDPRPAGEIALHTGLAKGTVHNLISNYNRFGPDVVEGPGKGGRRKSVLGDDEESDFLHPFIEMARQGHVVVASDIHRALEERVGRPIHHSIVYRFLHRNGWRKVAPRPRHVNSREDVQQEFKKNSRTS